MPNRRILSLWFPRLAAERMLRATPQAQQMPFAIVVKTGNAQHLGALSYMASSMGLKRGMGLTDARALCPELITRAEQLHKDQAFLAALRRWAERFTPWVSIEGEEALFLDVSGCAHLFGGEEGLVAQITQDCERFGLSCNIGVADTAGAAWAVARYGNQSAISLHTGDAINQEARATRSRSAKRHKWRHLDKAPAHSEMNRIIPPNHTRQALEKLPVEALRMDAEAIATLSRLGLYTIGDAANMPRAALARRIGLEAIRRLDQALGAEPEPISPARPEVTLACRLTLPDPIGLYDDLVAGIDRLLPPFCTKMKQSNKGLRALQITLYRADGTYQHLGLGLARPSRDADHIRPLILIKLKDADAGYGIDVIRIAATHTEPLTPTQHKGHVEAANEASSRLSPAGGAEFDALLSRLAARVGLDAMTRLAPAESHIPEKEAQITSAVYSEPVSDWPKPRKPRPVLMFNPEFVTPLDEARPPNTFRWRRRVFKTAKARGPERIAPEWWLDDPAWRSGPRDYWDIITQSGERLWIFEARGAESGGGWFAHGDFC